jgi:hypothetical protein
LDKVLSDKLRSDKLRSDKLHSDKLRLDKLRLDKLRSVKSAFGQNGADLPKSAAATFYRGQNVHKKFTGGQTFCEHTNDNKTTTMDRGNLFFI